MFPCSKFQVITTYGDGAKDFGTICERTKVDVGGGVLCVFADSEASIDTQTEDVC